MAGAMYTTTTSSLLCSPPSLCALPFVPTSNTGYALSALARLSLGIHSSMRTLALALSVCLSVFLSLALSNADVKYRVCFVLFCSFCLYVYIYRCAGARSLSLSLSCSPLLSIVPTSNTEHALSSLAPSLCIYPSMCVLSLSLSCSLSLALSLSFSLLLSCADVK